MTLHLVALPHTETTKEWESDAFTARTRVLGTMMAKHGNVILYSGEANESQVTEHVAVVDRAWQKWHFPDFKPGDVFSDYNENALPWQEFNGRVAAAIRQRAKPGDILGITMGVTHRPIAVLLDDLHLYHVEVGIGYSGIWAPFRVFESWAWRSYMAVRYPDSEDVRNFDETLPRAYEVEDFPAGDGKGGYFLFMGRLTARKGPNVASETCRRLGAKLIVVGPGAAKIEPGRITANDGTVLEGDVEYAGVVGVEERARLMGGAIATFVPTLYFEPFGGVHAESLLTGTPVITTPHGAFVEYVDEGVNGYKCRTLNEFVLAGRHADSLAREDIRRRAQARYGTETVARDFDAYLRRIKTLGREGWYELLPERYERAGLTESGHEGNHQSRGADGIDETARKSPRARARRANPRADRSAPSTVYR